MTFMKTFLRQHKEVANEQIIILVRNDSIAKQF